MLTITRTTWTEAQSTIEDIRTKVFIQEQNISESDEWDEHDQSADYFIAYLDGTAIGLARLIRLAGGAKIGRVATLKHFRRQGIATALIDAIINQQCLIQNEDFELTLGSQLTAQSLYQSLGFKQYGEIFLDAGIEHINMKRLISLQEIIQKKILKLIDTAQRQILIVSDDLNELPLNDKIIISALSAFCRHSRFNHLKILIRQPDLALKRQSDLYQLSRKLTSKIEFKHLSTATENVSLAQLVLLNDHTHCFVSEGKSHHRYMVDAIEWKRLSRQHQEQWHQCFEPVEFRHLPL